jgi:hypothetical protein
MAKSLNPLNPASAIPTVIASMIPLPIPNPTLVLVLDIGTAIHSTLVTCISDSSLSQGLLSFHSPYFSTSTEFEPIIIIK